MKYDNIKYKIVDKYISTSSISGFNCRIKWFALLILVTIFFVISFPYTKQRHHIILNKSELTINLTSTEKLDTSYFNFSSIIPPTIQLNTTETYKLAEKQSNVAFQYWTRWNNSIWHNDLLNKFALKYCDKIWLTHPFQLNHNNYYWQKSTSNNLTSKGLIDIYLYNAYYDTRPITGPVVVLLSANKIDKIARQIKWSCLLWFDGIRSPIVVEVSHYLSLMGDKPGYYHPQLITCPVPKEMATMIPQAVSLQSTNDCNQLKENVTNVLRIIYEPSLPTNLSINEPRIGVCVQALRFGTYDVSVRLIEWLEMVRILGAERVHFYVYGAMDNMRQVFEHYQRKGFIDWRPISLPGNQPNVDSLYNLWAFELGEKFWPFELVELNDCLYRNLYRYDFIAVFDIDEMILPKKVYTWQQLIQSVEKNLTPTTLMSKAYYYNLHSHVCEVFRDKERNSQPIPDYLYMMQHTYRSYPYSKWSNIKCFHKTSHISAIHNHSPIECVGNKVCQGLEIDKSKSNLWHYRRNQSHPQYTDRNYNCPIHERIAWKYYKRIDSSVRSKIMDIFKN